MVRVGGWIVSVTWDFTIFSHGEEQRSGQVTIHGDAEQSLGPKE